MTRYPKTGKGTKWTVRELANIPPEWAGDTMNDSNGLTGEVRKSADGSITVRFKFAFKWNGKVAWFNCGTYPLHDIAAIRQARDEAREAVKQGIDPRIKKQADKIEAHNEVLSVIAKEKAEREKNKTFQDMFLAWLDAGVSRQDDNANLISIFERDVLPFIGDKPVRTVTEQDLVAIYRNILSRATELTPMQRSVVKTSNDIRQLFKWAEQRQPWRTLLSEGNPALLVDISNLLSADYTEERDRVLSDAEIRLLDQLIRKEDEAYLQAENKRTAPRSINPRAQCAIWICFGTICRIGELLKARWEDVDFNARIWTIPMSNVKGKRGKKQDHYVYLSDFTLKHFQRLYALTGHTEWCFPSRNEETHVCVKSVSKIIGDRQTKFKDRPSGLKGRRNDNTLVVGDEEWTPHDLRRTGATMMQKLGVPLDIIDRCQNHVMAGSRVRRHYLKHDYAEEKQDAWVKLGGQIEQILK